MSAGGARIDGIDPAVGETVERHRGAAGTDHAQQNAGQLQPGERVTLLPGEGGASQCERQREERVTEANHLQQ